MFLKPKILLTGHGLAFIHHRYRTVFNGSDLGKGYVAKAVVGMFSDRDEVKVYLRKQVQGNYLEEDMGLGERWGKEEEGLSEKADYDDPTVIGKKKKKRPGEGQEQGFSL